MHYVFSVILNRFASCKLVLPLFLNPCKLLASSTLSDEELYSIITYGGSSHHFLFALKLLSPSSLLHPKVFVLYWRSIKKRTCGPVLRTEETWIQFLVIPQIFCMALGGFVSLQWEGGILWESSALRLVDVEKMEQHCSESFRPKAGRSKRHKFQK